MLCCGNNFIVRNSLSTLKTNSGVTLGDDISLMRLDDVVMAEWNNCFICLIALLSSVLCSDLTIGWCVAEGLHSCLRSSNAANSQSIEPVLGSLLFGDAVVFCVPFDDMTYV